jgi:malate dehydrogenase
MRKKISIFGAGNVGTSLAQLVVFTGLADCAMVDVAAGVAEGKALDLSQARPVYGTDVKIQASDDASIIKGSDLVVITAGITRKPGMSRDQLLETNARIVAQCASGVKKHAPKAFIIVVSNPLDAMTWLASEVSGFEKNKVMGMAGVLDSSRFISFLADALDASVKDIQAMVLGGHGDQMVPLLSYANWQGQPVEKLLPREELSKIVDRTRNAGAEIVAKMNTSAFYSPAASAFSMAKAIFYDEKRLVPCSAALNGEYGIKDIFLGVPVILGRGGVEKIVELKISKEEKAELEKSANSVQNLVNELKKLKI